MSLPALDTFLFSFVNRDLQNGFFDAVMPFITARSYLIFLPLYVWFFLKDKKKAFIALILGFASLLVADWTANALKNFFERPRPCLALEGARVLMGCGKSFSMPSNHAVNAFAFITPFYVMVKGRMRYAFAFVAFLVAFSRVYVGVHYPSDVIVGAFLGILLSLSIMRLYDWSAERFKVKPHSTVLIIFLLSISLFRIYYILNGPIDLSPDEAHYWEWSRRLDLSYYSKGPMMAYLIYLGTHIFGDTVFGIRIMAVIFSALSSVTMYCLGSKLYNGQVGLFSALLTQIIPLFSVYGVLFTIDSPFIFFWILAMFLSWESISNSSIVRAAEGDNGSRTGLKKSELAYWCLLGISIGLGMLTKYTMAFFYLCAFLFLLFSKENRKVLLTKGPYIAVIISVILFSPVIIWNANHDWVTLRHTAGQAHVAEGLRVSPKNLLEFVGSQFGVITPLLFILIGFSVWNLRRETKGKFLFWLSVPVFVFFLLKSIQAKVQANWAMPCYLAGIVAFSVFYLSRYHQVRKTGKALIAVAIAMSVFVTSIAHYASAFNVPLRLNPAARLYGWRELGAEVSEIYEKMSSTHPVFLFSDGYQVSSELAFYVRGHPVTYCIGLGRRMNQYDLWPGFGSLLHYDAIFVMTDDSRLPEKVAESFRKVEKKVFTVYTKKHAKIRDYSIFLCYDFMGLKEERPGTF